MTTVEGFAPFGDYKTWYRITGDLKSGKPPLFVLHGGPGCTHDYVDSYKLVAESGRAVIHYDQIGNGKSTHLPEKGGDFWVPDFFVAELNNLIDHLGVRSAYHVLGQSWGGMLGAEFAVRKPAGLKGLIIANSPAEMKTWISEAYRLRSELPQSVQDALLKHEKAGTTDSAEYRAAETVFNETHVCRVVPMPPEVKRTFDAIAADPTVYHTMNGPNEFYVIGTMKDWTIVDRLPAIEVPTLLISGYFDEATPATVQPYMEKIRDVRWVKFPNSSHMPHVEEKEACIKVTVDFLDATDAA
ncbi:proline iminopeptidase-family hydrolase [Oryzibacter oryziterrae]|uniref:proline iminopeptidase-family hydrolase n=1 Tax=Oryzibacter oryziterrae TaxID=2766474 RepID=UPI001F00D00C|nr:proline iminopeptidase-family hydrolase [Oryzibacter oryziterrae]